MENLDLNAKKLELLTDEELKEVTGGSDPFAETLKVMNKAKCDSAKKRKDCEKLDICIWRVGPTFGSEMDGVCYYKG